MLDRVDPRRDAAWVNSVIVCVRDYGKYKLPSGMASHIGRNYLADYRIPSCPDHAMPHRMTQELERLGFRVERGGLPDRLAGARAGVVRIGRNGFAYHKDAGSWINVEFGAPTRFCPLMPQPWTVHAPPTAGPASGPARPEPSSVPI